MKCLHTVFTLLSLFTLLTLLSPLTLFIQNGYYAHTYNRAYQARALGRALGLLLADGTPTVGGGKTF